MPAFTRTLLALVGFLAVGLALASAELQAKLESPEFPGDPGQLLVDLVIHNTGDWVEIPQRLLPLDNGQLPQDLFDVRDAEGRSMDYVGMMARRAAEAPAVLRLAPGASQRFQVDLSLDYALAHDGWFAATYRTRPQQDEALRGLASSNTIQLRVQQAAGDRRRHEAPEPELEEEEGFLAGASGRRFPTFSKRRALPSINCDATHLRMVEDAERGALNITRGSVNCMRSGTCQPSFQRWFGSQSSSNYNQVLQQTSRMFNQFQASNYRAHCNARMCQSDVVGWAGRFL